MIYYYLLQFITIYYDLQHFALADFHGSVWLGISMLKVSDSNANENQNFQY